jgi:hypothetical protein
MCIKIKLYSFLWAIVLKIVWIERSITTYIKKKYSEYKQERICVWFDMAEIFGENQVNVKTIILASELIWMFQQIWGVIVVFYWFNVKSQTTD